MKSISSIGRTLGCGLLALVVGLGGFLHPASAQADAVATPAPRPPDRRELWVPLERLGPLLQREKAVMLTRSQYEALLRDAGVEQSKPVLPPRRVTLSSAQYRGRLQGQVVVLEAELRFSVLSDDWAEVPLEFSGCTVGTAKLDAESALIPRMPHLQISQAQAKPVVEECPTTLLLRGKGEHVLTLTLTAPLQAEAGRNRLSLVVPATAAGALTLALPPETQVESNGLPVKAQSEAKGVTATVALAPAANRIDLQWRTIDLARGAAVPLASHVVIRYALDAERLAADYQFDLQSGLGDLPEKFEITLPREAKVLNVQVAELARWEAREGKVTVTLQAGHRQKSSLHLAAEFATLGPVDRADLSLPIPELAGAPRLAGDLVVEADESVVVREVTTAPVVRRVANEAEPRVGGFQAKFTFESRPAEALRIKVQRAQPKLEADLDTLVAFRADAIEIERTITLRPEQGKRFATSITLPDGEELVSVRQMSAIPRVPIPANTLPETEPQWRAEKNVITVTWTDKPETAPVLRLRSRQEPAGWADLPADGLTFQVRDARIDGASKVAGYLALTAEAAFRLEATPGETLERRDGRKTPVRGEYAWFRRESFELGVRIFKRPAEVLAVLTGYALPLEGVLDLHAVMKYQFLHGGTREVKVRVPAALAANFQFEGTQIAERALTGDVWRITFQKELTGAYDLAISAQVPVAKVTPAGGAEKGYSFAVDVPVIVPLEVARTSGLWAVEANTETEISFEARGLTELDSLSAPRLADYQPTHRVIGVFGWIGADYALKLRGVRHAPAALITTVVDRVNLETVASPGGLHRHQATLHLRTAGAQYLDVSLPANSALLSLLVDGAPLKPVAAPGTGGAGGSVRVRLPAKRDANAEVAIVMVYETKAPLWESRGALQLMAPQLANEIPVLQSRWRVWLPEGFTYAGYESGLHGPQPAVEPALAVLAAERMRRWLGWQKPETQAALAENDQFGDFGIIDAEVRQLREPQPSLDVDVSTFEVNAPTAYRFAAPQTLVAPAKPDGAPLPGDFNGRVMKGQGALLPVLIDLPRSGRAVTFAGLSAPKQVTLRYYGWWSRAQRLWLWFVGGGVVFYWLGRQRPVWRTLWALLILTAIPMMGWGTAAPMCNALLAGWLAGVGLHLLTFAAIARSPKEVLA